MLEKETFRIIHRRTTALLIMMLLIMLSILPAWGADKAKDEETIGNATNVLTAMLSGGAVPPDVLAKANCVVVIPKYKRAVSSLVEAAAVDP